ncbi:hypothetical protein CapIbe_011500 [Capra ibex]
MEYLSWEVILELQPARQKGENHVKNRGNIQGIRSTKLQEPIGPKPSLQISEMFGGAQNGCVWWCHSSSGHLPDPVIETVSSALAEDVEPYSTSKLTKYMQGSGKENTSQASHLPQ